MKKIITLIIATWFLYLHNATGQKLKPGFDKAEYIELLKLTAKNGDPELFKAFPYPDHFKWVYRSPTMGLENMWELWTSADNVAALSIRGTADTLVSWLANTYAAMVPAKGELKISNDYTFQYELADNPQAAIHVGWLISTAFLSQDMLPKIDSCYNAGIRDIYIVGHSQGGGISYLLTAYLYSLQRQNKLPADIRFKTYCSAAPKPGNLYFAYEYEALTQPGWAYNVVNANDWVPEVPFSIQTINDFNKVNPFLGATAKIKEQKFFQRIALQRVYNKLSKPGIKAQKNYEKYLGDLMSGYVKKHIPDFQAPPYFHSNHYVRTGNTIVLLGDEAYYQKFPIDTEKTFGHHLPNSYLYLAEKL